MRLRRPICTLFPYTTLFRSPCVIAAIKDVTGVLDVHDLHVWMVGPGVIACSCHIVVGEQSVREGQQVLRAVDRKSTRLNSSHTVISYAVFCLKKKKTSRD